MRTVSFMTEVENGAGFLITRRGRPIARLVSHTADKAADPEWAAAYQRMMVRLEEGAALGGPRVKRDEPYDR